MPLALEVTAGPRKGDMFRLFDEEAVTIGRDSANNYQIKDRKLSRIHCQLELIDGRCLITDLNSTNGTRVNDVQINSETWLLLGDKIEIGRSVLQLVEVSDAALADEAQTRSGEAEDDSALEGITGPRCEECKRPVSEKDVERGLARHVGDRYYCAKCMASFDDASASQPHIEPAETSRQLDILKPDAEVAGVRVISHICEGRLGHIYKGEQISMGRVVTLKMINVGDADWARKYLNAVYASGRLVHQNIVLLFDTGEENDAHYLVREYVEGESLQNRLANRRPMPVTRAYNIITQIVYALEHAADRQIVHGQLSPRKILIEQKDVVKITDFGLPQYPPPGISDSIYRRHALPYTAPERLDLDSPPNFAGDVYSAVAILYHMLAGQAPFSGSTREKLERRILNRQPRPLSAFVEHVPDAAQKIVDRGLLKDPRARYQTPRELLYDLEENLRREI